MQDRERRHSLEQPNTERQLEHQSQPLLHNATHQTTSSLRNNSLHNFHLQSYSDDFAPENTGPSADMWNSLWLHGGVLIGFSVAFALMALSVGLLYHFSEAENGLASQVESRHYLWTFGPTACMLVVFLLSKPLFF